MQRQYTLSMNGLETSLVDSPAAVDEASPVSADEWWLNRFARIKAKCVVRCTLLTRSSECMLGGGNHHLPDLLIFRLMRFISYIAPLNGSAEFACERVMAWVLLRTSIDWPDTIIVRCEYNAHVVHIDELVQGMCFDRFRQIGIIDVGCVKKIVVARDIDLTWNVLQPAVLVRDPSREAEKKISLN